jgi:hypothetical protein
MKAAYTGIYECTVCKKVNRFKQTMPLLESELLNLYSKGDYAAIYRMPINCLEFACGHEVRWQEIIFNTNMSIRKIIF